MKVGEENPNFNRAQCLVFLMLRHLDICRIEIYKLLALQNNAISFAEDG
jgi:hypothetical protein